MDKSTVILRNLEGYEGRCNDVVFCGSEGQQHVVFFPGDVQVSIFALLKPLTVSYNQHNIYPLTFLIILKQSFSVF